MLRLSGDNNSGYDSGYSGRDSEASNGISNPDLQASVPQILQQLDTIRTSHKHVLQLWQHKKLKLDQCFQLRLFEQDCEKVKCYYVFYCDTYMDLSLCLIFIIL